MKWALVADLQLDTYAANSVVTPDGVTSRLRDMMNCWGWVCDTCSDERVEAIAVLGDIFNNRTAIDLPVLDVACRAFHDASAYFGLYVLAGNHDSYLRHPGVNSLQVFQGYATVIDKPFVHSNGFGFVPWQDDPANLRGGVELALKHGAKVLLSHALVEGVAGPAGVPLAYLQPSRFECVYLGDVHDPLQIADNVRYVGSPMQIDYRDAGRARGFLTLDDADPAGSAVYHENTTSPRFYVVRDADAVPAGIDHTDFVRVQIPDAETALEVAARMKQVTPWVESRVASVADDSPPPRLAVRTGQTHQQVFDRYTRYKRPEAGSDEVGRLVEVGLELLRQAGG